LLFQQVTLVLFYRQWWLRDQGITCERFRPRENRLAVFSRSLKHAFLDYVKCSST